MKLDVSVSSRKCVSFYLDNDDKMNCVGINKSVRVKCVEQSLYINNFVCACERVCVAKIDMMASSH